MKEFSALKGFKDLLPGESERWEWVESISRKTFRAFGFSPIRTPILERTALFTRSIGETSDIVEKEMYTFQDWNGGRITLRPEGTASVVRAYLEHRSQALIFPTKFYYSGPMFRHERPQAGRLRQFHQLGAEIIGEIDPRQDVELLSLLHTFFLRLDVEGLTLEINSLGCPVCRPAYRASLQAYLEKHLPALCEDCQRRFTANPLRILDCKKKECRVITKQAPPPMDHLCQECSDHFKAVEEGLQGLKISYKIQPHLVRGLDYYTKTAFEMTTTALGAQNAVAAGGRYDGLIAALGGPATPAIGFAIGMERLMKLVPLSPLQNMPLHLYLIPLGKTAGEQLFPVLYGLRQKDICCEMGKGNASLKNQMKRADRLGARFVLIVGEDEIAQGRAVLRDMTTKKQTNIELTDLANTILSQIVQT
ncbi:MAG: histidine--tRNA ligase [Nitrospira sp.]|nr:histidine--tRNA ligase [Candidatus Manganitrophaceae bacterium]HIL34489.1 histidine--tRNA ligase [Candidatus Manganitrophaceae bacterium]